MSKLDHGWTHDEIEKYGHNAFKNPDTGRQITFVSAISYEKGSKPYTMAMKFVTGVRTLKLKQHHGLKAGERLKPEHFKDAEKVLAGSGGSPKPAAPVVASPRAPDSLPIKGFDASDFKGRVFPTIDSIQKHVYGDTQREYAKKLDKKTLRDIDDYKEHWAGSINGSLRRGEAADETVDRITSAIKTAPPTTRDVTAVRAVSDPGIIERIEAAARGDNGGVFSDPAFISTAMHMNTGRVSKFGSTKLVIDIPKGTRALFLNDILSDSFNSDDDPDEWTDGEVELLLQRGSKFKVKAVRNGGVYGTQYHVDLVP